ncbi:MAG TPA: hypothetical protein VFD80_04405 [Flavobacteriaceae bacterium]|nr:hypothetical protein [Flavobacteriaceae bacterium]
MTSLLTLLMAAVLEIVCPAKQEKTENSSTSVKLMEMQFEGEMATPFTYKVLRNT